MPMDFLARIEEASFPLAVRDEGDIHCAAVLHAAQLIEAMLPPARSEPGSRVAIILRVTPLGRAKLNAKAHAGERREMSPVEEN